MAGPWEAYGGGAQPAAASPVTEGPWATYRQVTPTAPAAPVAAKPDIGSAESARRGLMQGVLAGWNDELSALTEAGGGDPTLKNDTYGIDKLVMGLAKYWFGDKEAQKKYDEVVGRERAADKTAKEAHPYIYGGSELGGALLTAPAVGGDVAQGVNLGQRVLQGARGGAIYGGVSGAGEGEGLTQKVTGGASGAALGGALGAAAPIAIEGLIQGGRAVAQPVVNAVRGVRDVDSEAARRVAVALERDIRADPQAANRLTPQEFAASVQSDGPATIMDIGGDTTRALARSAANTSPEARTALNQTINDRFEGQSARVNNWLRETFNYPNAEAQSAALADTARNINRANYTRALREGDREIISPEIERLMGAPAMVDAMRRASQSGKDRAVTQGYGAFNPGVTVENGMVNFRRGPNGQPTYPNLAFWDATKKELDDAASAAARAGRNGEAGVIGDLARSLRGELDAAVPSYANARAGAAHFFGAQDALEAGQNFVNRNMTSGDARRALAQMSATERNLFQDGFVSRFTETLNQIGDRRSILNKIAESPAAREKLNVALGYQRAAELEAGLRVEGIMDLARGAVQGNSTTARQLAELGLAGGAFGFSGGVNNPLDPGAVMNAAIVYGALKGKNAINERLSRRVAEMLTSQNPRILMQGIRTLANNRTLFNSLRSADRGLARIGGEQAPVSASLQAAGVSRAEDQPGVPRPPGK